MSNRLSANGTKIAVAAVLCSAGVAAQAALVNPGFEAGLTGWTLNDNGGTISVVSSFSSFLPKEGNSFLKLQPADDGTSAGWMTVAQSVTLAAGEVLRGWVGFENVDYKTSGDAARVKVNGAELFYCDSFILDGPGSVAWTKWSYIAPTAGSYLVELAAFDADAIYPSVAVFDALVVVPEPSTWLAGGVMTALAGLSILREQRRRKTA